MSVDRLTICYNAWILFGESDDYTADLQGMLDRGFNCLRFEDGAGILWDADGKERRDVRIHAPFGKYTKYTTYKTVMTGTINPLERLLKLCRTAHRLGVRLIPSSWFFLHTNWFLDEELTRPLFELTTEEKIAYFGDELDRILCLLKAEGIADVVAFAEIFNEFDGLPFAGEYQKVLPEPEALHLRDLHEAAIDKLRAHHPDILFAYDSWRPNMQECMIPRNIDVLNFHFYYARPIYGHFENGCIGWTFNEREIPPETAQYLVEDRLKIDDIIEGMGGLPKTGRDWPSIIRLYASIDEDKTNALCEMLDKHLTEEYNMFSKRMHDGIETAMQIHARVVPDSRLVFGEGATYCASPTLMFESRSAAAWKLFEEQMRLLAEKNFWGSVVRTNARPSDGTWNANAEDYLRVNRIFLHD